MHELICPNCGKPFRVDEADYAFILNQVKGREFDTEVSRRIEELHKQQLAEQKAVAASLEKAHQSELFQKDQIISNKDGELSRLKEQLSAMNDRQKLAVGIAIADKDKEIASLKEAIAQKESETQIAIIREQQKNEESLRGKDAVISKLRSDAQIAQSEAALHEKSIREDYEAKLKIAQEQVAYYKDLKTRMSTKMVGETLEAHCSIIFNGEMRPMFPNAYFEKDNDASEGSKGDYIFRDFVDGTEYISIMFEMKNEMDETATKHKNEDFFKKLDEDRTKKGCEYAVLVSLLESDSDLYNGGIVDVSWKYPKMFVIRPQFFRSIIMLLVNAAKNTVEVKRELIIARSQDVDVTNFEQKLISFQDRFRDHYSRASIKNKDAIEQIDATIKKLQSIKKLFEQSDHYLRLANQDSEEFTIRKLTYNNPTMKAKFEEARKKEQKEATDNQES